MKRKKIVHIVAHHGIAPMVIGKDTLFVEGGEVFVCKMHTSVGAKVGMLKKGVEAFELKSMLQDLMGAIDEAHRDEYAFADLRPHLNDPREWIVKKENREE